MNIMKDIFLYCHYFHQNLQLYIFWPIKIAYFLKILILGVNFSKFCIFGIIFKIYNKFWSRKLTFGGSTFNFKNDHFLTIISSECNWSLEPCPTYYMLFSVYRSANLWEEIKRLANLYLFWTKVSTKIFIKCQLTSF